MSRLLALSKRPAMSHNRASPRPAIERPGASETRARNGDSCNVTTRVVHPRPSFEGALSATSQSADGKSQNLSAAVVDVEVGLLQGQRGAEFRPHRLVVTDEVLVMTAIGSRADCVAHLFQNYDTDGDGKIDLEEFHEITRQETSDAIRLTDIDVLEDVSSDERQEGAWEWQSGIMMIHTKSQGHNAGRKYCLRVGADTADFAALLAKMRWLVVQAKRAALEQTWRAKFHRSRLLVKSMFVSSTWQLFVSLLIFANFMANAIEAQYKLSLANDDGTPTALGQTLIHLDLFFTWIFTFELLLNLYAHWKDEFVKDGWNNFDLFVVSIGHIASILPGNLKIPITIFRLLRVFRVLRIFGKLKSIRHIINALIASLIPVLNAFFIMGIVLVMYAIIGTTLFEGVDRQFDTLDRVIMLLFRVAAGETWIDGVDVTDEHGNINWALGAYVMIFTVLVNWTLLQVSVAVLLDNFVSETAREKDHQFRLEQEAHRVKDTVVNVLDPLLCIIANEYVDDHHLCNFLRTLFRVMSQGQECLDPPALCKALTALDVTPPVHFTRLDYAAFTQATGAALEEGVGVEDFVMLMRYQVRGYIERKLQRSVSEASIAKEQSSFSTLASLKELMSDVHYVKSDLKQLHEGMGCILSRLYSLDSHPSKGENAKRSSGQSDDPVENTEATYPELSFASFNLKHGSFIRLFQARDKLQSSAPESPNTITIDDALASSLHAPDKVHTAEPGLRRFSCLSIAPDKLQEFPVDNNLSTASMACTIVGKDPCSVECSLPFRSEWRRLSAVERADVT